MSDLPPAVAAILAAPADSVDPGRRSVTVAAGIPFSALAWGEAADRPVVLIHGITASARIWWRVGPALAASGRSVWAVDLPGHGQTGHWAGHHRFRDTAADVASWIRAMSVDVPELGIVGHSWGAMVAAALPVAGIRPATLVLLEPPTVPQTYMAQQASDTSGMLFPDLETAVREIGLQHPDWPEEDVRAHAESLAQTDVDGARAVVLGNGDWDGGLADLFDPATDGIPTWLIRGDPAVGGVVPEAVLPAYSARIGADHVVTLPGAGHSPQRLQPADLTAALLGALG